MSYQQNTTADYQFVCGQRQLSAEAAAGRYAFVSLGSNLPSTAGDCEATLIAALRRLRSFAQSPVLVSSLWQTEPLDCPAGSPVFINAVAALEVSATGSAIEMLDSLQAIEREFGRQRSGVGNAARTVDLDLISYRSVSLSSERLVLPHPRAVQRRFVLQPMVELAPELVLPGQFLDVTQLLAQLGDQGRLQRLM